ncbi:hypothetical protein RJ639_037632 [Escallonia herrerae]|uniref:Uncharacterized protein n=1 Tax=Escallonia herrerae TaxID=1293975 RepID=A0AA88WNG9_9ASTE|nr:hypothetical protein RJ639_037632 [Escallonia herrerae]
MKSKLGSLQSSFSDGSTSTNLENEAAAVEAAATKDQHVMDPILGLLVRRVKEESAREKLLPTLKWSSENEIHTSDTRSLKLQFFNKISSPVLTGERIQGGEGASITVALVDCLTEQVVKSGPEALAEVELLFLKEIQIFSVETIGHLKCEIHITHNRNWFKNCQFRLGARVVNNDLGIQVKEAKTDPFDVKDRRKIYDKKCFPPSLSDEVCRLKTIGRKGKYHQRLSEANINNVKDFLTSYNTDPQMLQQILGPGAKLKEPVNHARTCIVTDKIYLYNSPNLEPSTGVVLNVVGEADAQKSVLSAFQHWADVLQFDDENSFIQILNNSLNPLNSSGLGCLDDNNHASSEMNSNYVQTQPSTFFPDIVSSTSLTEDMTYLDNWDSFDINNMESARDQGLNPGDCNLQYENTSVTYAHQENDASIFTSVDSQDGRSGKARKKWPWIRLRCALTLMFLIRRKVLRLKGIHVPKKVKFG